MRLTVQVFVRAHHGGLFTMEVVGEPALCLHTPDLEKGREELALALCDRVERTHPRLLGRYAAPAGLALETVEVPGTLPVEGREEALPAPVSVLVARDRQWQRLWLPRWDVRHWIPVGEPPAEAVIAFLRKHFERLGPAERLARRVERREWIETLEIEADPAPAERFTGKRLGADMLPEPAPKDDEPPEDEAPKKKKRPPTPTLGRVGVNLSKQAAAHDLDHAFGRDAPLADLIARLRAPGGLALVIIGESGVGKTALLDELVHRLRADEHLKDRPVWFADANRLVAGDGGFGEWQRQCLDIAREAIDAEAIWYLGNPLALLDAGKSEHSDQNVAQVLKPYLSGRELTVIAECTPRAWAQVELREAGFARLFVPYRLEEPPPAEAHDILAAVARQLREDTGVELRPDGLRAVEDLAERFRGDQSRLGHAAHFLRRVVDEAALRAEGRTVALDRGAVVDRFCAETGMPAFLVRDDLPLDPDALHAHFRGRLIGQDEAVRRMTDLVALVKAGLSDVRRPLGSFLFVGPTGVGKTEMAKALAELLFGRGREHLLRFDMGEFVTADSVHRFLGDAGQPGSLIAQVRRSPFAVLLLDEIEKAHPALFDVLLQVLGEARLTDQAGRTADFRNTVVLMTSNLGVETFRRSPGFGGEAPGSLTEHFVGEARRFFRPELFNRIDHVVPFMPLERQAIDRITTRELDAFLGREGIRQRGLDVSLEEGLPDWLAERGVDPRYGARPLKRVIEARLAAPLARYLSGAEATPAVRVETADDALRFVGRDARAGRAAGREKLRRQLAEVGRVRQQLQQWRASQPYTDLAHGLRLLDRLTQTRGFWDDAAAADARMRRAEPGRQLHHAFEALWTRVGSLEDMAYEAWYEGKDDPLPLLEQELAAVTETLRGLELDLYGRRFRRPDAAMLYLEGPGAALRAMVDLYLRLAVERQWAVAGWFADERAAETRKPRNEEAARRGRPRRSKDPEAWLWYVRGGIDAASDNPMKQQERLLRALTDEAPGQPRALRFTGPHAAALLSRETGVHLVVNAGSDDVKVRFADDPEPTHPLDVMRAWDLKRRRVIHHGRHTVEDLELSQSLPLEPRVHRLYERFMQQGFYAAVFGEMHALFTARGPA